MNKHRLYWWVAVAIGLLLQIGIPQPVEAKEPQVVAFLCFGSTHWIPFDMNEARSLYTEWNRLRYEQDMKLLAARRQGEQYHVERPPFLAEAVPLARVGMWIRGPWAGDETPMYSLEYYRLPPADGYGAATATGYFRMFKWAGDADLWMAATSNLTNMMDEHLSSLCGITGYSVAAIPQVVVPTPTSTLVDNLPLRDQSFPWWVVGVATVAVALFFVWRILLMMKRRGNSN